MRGEEKGEASKRTQDKTREDKIRPEMRSYILIFFPMYSMKRQVFRRYSSSFWANTIRIDVCNDTSRQRKTIQGDAIQGKTRQQKRREDKQNIITTMTRQDRCKTRPTQDQDITKTRPKTQDPRPNTKTITIPRPKTQDPRPRSKTKTQDPRPKTQDPRPKTRAKIQDQDRDQDQNPDPILKTVTKTDTQDSDQDRDRDRDQGPRPKTQDPRPKTKTQ